MLEKISLKKTFTALTALLFLFSFTFVGVAVTEGSVNLEDYESIEDAKEAEISEEQMKSSAFFSFEIQPGNEEVTAGEWQEYSAHHSYYGDVTDSTDWSDDAGDSSEWDNNQIRITEPGEWTITGKFSGVFSYEDDAALTVKEDQVQEIKIKTQPKLEYFQGEDLDLTDMEVKLIYEFLDSEVVPYNHEDISNDSEHETELEAENDGETVTVTHEPSGQTADTDELTVLENAIAVEAMKVVCEDESDLPEWGDEPGIPKGHNINPKSVGAWVAETDECEFYEDEWEFQWAYGEEDNPGDNEGVVEDEAWNLFSNNEPAEINLNGYSTIAVREVMREGYLPFSEDLQDSESAEFYCHEDVYNYDNLEYIEDIEPENTYYCAGFNVFEYEILAEIGEVDDVEVDYGTSEEDARDELDDEVTITSESGEEETAQIEDWEIQDYDGESPGDYDATGSVVLPEGWSSEPAPMQAQENNSLTIEATVTVGEAPPEPTTSAASGQRRQPYPGTTQGEVLGEEDIDIPMEMEEILGEEDEVCEPYLTEFIRQGRDNNPEEVRKLQEFLNDYQGENLSVTGFYGLPSVEAVMTLQSENAEEILEPWGINEPTGFVYKTTLRFINQTQCPDEEFPMPELTPASGHNQPAPEVLGETDQAEREEINWESLLNQTDSENLQSRLNRLAEFIELLRVRAE